MSSDYYKFKLSEKNGEHVVWILCIDDPGSNRWEEGEPSSGVLLIKGGPLTTNSTGQHCFDDNNHEILVLRGASWKSKVGDTGDAELSSANQSSPYFDWEMVKKYTK